MTAPTPAKTSVWAMAIPRNGKNKERAWSMIKHLSLRENTIAATLNGNGPVRPSAYEDGKVKALIPYASAEKEALVTARLVVPGFANNAKAMDIFYQVREVPGLKKKPSTSELIDWLKLLLHEDMPLDVLQSRDPSKAIPPLHGALLKNEQDVMLFERLAFMSRRPSS